MRERTIEMVQQPPGCQVVTFLVAHYNDLFKSTPEQPIPEEKNNNNNNDNNSNPTTTNNSENNADSISTNGSTTPLNTT